MPKTATGKPSKATQEEGRLKPYLAGDSDSGGMVNTNDLNALALNWRQEVSIMEKESKYSPRRVPKTQFQKSSTSGNQTDCSDPIAFCRAIQRGMTKRRVVATRSLAWNVTTNPLKLCDILAHGATLLVRGTGDSWSVNLVSYDGWRKKQQKYRDR
jgi:hypothetical protein